MLKKVIEKKFQETNKKMPKFGSVIVSSTPEEKKKAADLPQGDDRQDLRHSTN